MSIKKSLLGLAAVAIVTMAFASPATATDGKLRDITGTELIAENTVLHLVGWTKFTTEAGSFVCHTTWNIKAVGGTGTTGSATSYTAPDPTKCTGTGLFNGCKVTKYEVKNLPYHVTITDNGRVDITGNIEIHNTYSSCAMTTTLLTFSEIQLTPLKTGTRTVTGTENKLGETAALNEPIAGFEVDGSKGPGGVGSGLMHIKDIFGAESTGEITFSGEFELTSDTRCTYEISAT